MADLAPWGLLFKDPMALAARDGRKTCTRRVGDRWGKCGVGRELWVREVFALWGGDGDADADDQVVGMGAIWAARAARRVKVPNHYTNVVQIIQDGARDDYDTFGERLKKWWTEVDPCERVRPMPPEYRTKNPRDERWYHWASSGEGWGTKWGLYEPKVVELPGDAQPWLATACSAWGPPNYETRERIALAILGLGALKVWWSGIDPYNDSFADLGVWDVDQRAPVAPGLH